MSEELGGVAGWPPSWSRLGGRDDARVSAWHSWRWANLRSRRSLRIGSPGDRTLVSMATRWDSSETRFRRLWVLRIGSRELVSEIDTRYAFRSCGPLCPSCRRVEQPLPSHRGATAATPLASAAKLARPWSATSFSQHTFCSFSWSRCWCSARSACPRLGARSGRACGTSSRRSASRSRPRMTRF